MNDIDSLVDNFRNSLESRGVSVTEMNVASKEGVAIIEYSAKMPPPVAEITVTLLYDAPDADRA